MIRKNIRRKCESVEDPRELLLSLVDMGSIDIEDAFLACVREMSDAECKRILNSISLPSNTELSDEQDEDVDEDVEDVTVDDEKDLDSFEDDEETVVPESLRRHKLEHRLRKLESMIARRRK